MSSTTDDDLDVVRERYRQERDKRVRTDGRDQFVAARGALGSFDEDPYAERDFHRPAVDDEVEVAIVGGGFGGLVTAARLRKLGLGQIRIIDRAADFGGTWYWNRYPGAQCDIESYLYLPLLEETGYVPSRRYVSGAEIFDYAKLLGRHFELYDDALFQTTITQAAWDEDVSRWVIGTNRGDQIRAKFLILSSGPLSRPKLPGVPGLEDFDGVTFHTSRWDYDYTGGDIEGGLSELAGKRVGLIGTGATAIQVVPKLGEAADELYVFQRTPSSVSPRLNRPTDPDWFASFEPGWQKDRMENFNSIVMGQQQGTDLIEDSWTYIYKKVASWKTMKSEDQAAAMAAAETSDFTMMKELRGRIADIVHDPVTAAGLQPWYRLFCKRPCFSDTYLETFNRPSVTLVDTNGLGIERITPAGIVVDGHEYDLDCIVFATGFEVGTSFTDRNGFDVIGRAGQKLSERWKRGHRTLHGLSAHGFPNLFFTGVVQGALLTNFTHLLIEQAEHIAYLVNLANERGAIEPTEQAEQAWVDVIRQPTAGQALLLECTPGFYNNEGKLDQPGGWVAESFGAGSIVFFQLLHDWRAAGGLEDLQFAIAREAADVAAR